MARRGRDSGRPFAAEEAVYGIGDVAYRPPTPVAPVAATNIDAIRAAINQSLTSAGFTPPPVPTGYQPAAAPAPAPAPVVEPNYLTDYAFTPNMVVDKSNTQGMVVNRKVGPDGGAPMISAPISTNPAVAYNPGQPTSDVGKAVGNLADPFVAPVPVPAMPRVRGVDPAALAAVAARAAIAPPPAAPVQALEYDYSGGAGDFSQAARGFRHGGAVMLRGVFPDDTPAFAEGGLVDAAEQVRGAGRFGDDYLVHIQPEEFAELQQMYGEPTINPETGLPEFFLGIKLGKVGKFLKAAVRVGATIAGAAVGGPAGAALGAGLSTKLTGGSWKEALGSAALSGIGTFAMAPSAGLLGKGTVLSNALAGTGVGNALGAQAAAPLTTSIAQGAAPSISQAAHGGSAFAQAAARGAAMNAAGVVNPVAPSLVSSGLSAAASALAKPGSLALIGGAGLLSAAAPSAPKSDVFTSGIGGTSDYTLNVGPYDRGPVTFPVDLANYGRSGGEYQFFSAVNPNPVITQVPVPVAPKKKKAAGGPISGLGGFADGGAAGYIDAPGGGQDDRETILVSGGEYVVDADVVSALGDGNNAEGAARLDRMRENIRRQKRRAPVTKIPPKAKAPEAYMRAS